MAVAVDVTDVPRPELDADVSNAPVLEGANSAICTVTMQPPTAGKETERVSAPVDEGTPLKSVLDALFPLVGLVTCEVHVALPLVIDVVVLPQRDIGSRVTKAAIT